MNEGIHLDLDTWIVPGQIRKANLCRGLGNRYTPAGTEVLISAVVHNTPPPFQAVQNATIVNTRSSVAPCSAQRHTLASLVLGCYIALGCSFWHAFRSVRPIIIIVIIIITE